MNKSCHVLREIVNAIVVETNPQAFSQLCLIAVVQVFEIFDANQPPAMVYKYRSLSILLACMPSLCQIKKVFCKENAFLLTKTERALTTFPLTRTPVLKKALVCVRFEHWCACDFGRNMSCCIPVCSFDKQHVSTANQVYFQRIV